MLDFPNLLYITDKKICKVWDLNPRVLSTNDLKSLPLDRSGNLAIQYFYFFYPNKSKFFNIFLS